MSKFELMATGKLKNRALFPAPPKWCMTRERILNRIDIDSSEVISLSLENKSEQQLWLASFNSQLHINPSCFMIEPVGFEKDFHRDSKFKIEEFLPSNIGMQTPVLFLIDGKRCGIMYVKMCMHYCDFIIESLEGKLEWPKK